MNTYEQKLDILADIVEELMAREMSNNCVIEPYRRRSWDELCAEGIRLFSELSKGGFSNVAAVGC